MLQFTFWLPWFLLLGGIFSCRHWPVTLSIHTMWDAAHCRLQKRSTTSSSSDKSDTGRKNFACRYDRSYRYLLYERGQRLDHWRSKKGKRTDWVCRRASWIIGYIHRKTKTNKNSAQTAGKLMIISRWRGRKKDEDDTSSSWGSSTSWACAYEKTSQRKATWCKGG